MFTNNQTEEMHMEFNRFVDAALDCDTKQGLKSIKKMAEIQQMPEDLVLLGLAITFVGEPEVARFVKFLIETKTEI